MERKKHLLCNAVIIAAAMGIACYIGFTAGVNNQPIEGGFACSAYDNGLVDGYDVALAEYNITPEDKLMACGAPSAVAAEIRDKCDQYGIEMDY